MDFDKFLKKASEALRRRNPAQAIALYKQVLAANPGSPQARKGMLAAYARKHELKGGPSLMDRAAAKSAKAVALGLRSQRRWEALAKSCDTGLAKDPGDASLLAMLAEALEELGYQGAALATWEFRIEQDDRDSEALKAAGKLHYSLRNIPEAMDYLDRARRANPRDPEVEKLRKNLAAEGTLETTRFESAASSRELIKDADSMREAARERRLHAAAEEIADDVETLEQQFEQDPGDTRVALALADALAKGSRYHLALEVLERILEAHPEDSALLDRRGRIRLESNQAALKGARAAGDAEAEERLRAERAAIEVEEYGRRLERDPHQPDLRLRLGRALFRAGEVDRAIETFQEAVKSDRVVVEARQGLGICFFRKGLFPLAKRQLEQALGAADADSDIGKEICYHLGLVCERMDDPQGALEQYLSIYERDINFKDVAKKVEQLGADG